MSLQSVFGTNTALTGWSTALASVADGGTSYSASVSNVEPNINLECEFTADGAATGTVDIYMLSSTDGGTGFSTYASLSNPLFIGSVTLNGTTLVRKVFHVENVPDDWQILVDNNGGAGLGTSTVSYQTHTINNV